MRCERSFALRREAVPRHRTPILKFLSNRQVASVFESSQVRTEAAVSFVEELPETAERELVVPGQQHSRSDPRSMLQQIVELDQFGSGRSAITLLLHVDGLPEARRQ